MGVDIDVVVTDPSLKSEANPEGRVSVQHIEGDTATNHFMSLFGMLMSGAGSSGTKTITDLTNTSRTIAAWAAASATTYNSNNASDRGVRISIGNGNGSTVSPARTDYAMVQSTQTTVAGASSVSGGLTTVAVAFVNGSGSNWTGSTAIRECGLILSMAATNGTGFDALMFHDAITATTVNTGQTITITYTFTWP